MFNKSALISKEEFWRYSSSTKFHRHVKVCE